ncbi:UvrD-helicase domain-containing protein [Serratia marcescens]|uniref:UvrD-helicase domain-containing protein n=1 Tax=Serratia marcescens TaxID=615 RepID=UPI0040649B0F
MKHFNSQQMDYIESSISSSIYLEACPGSGKTEVIAAKVAKEINNWTLSPGGIALLSFSNSATDELFSRVKKYTPIRSVDFHTSLELLIVLYLSF